MKRISGTVVGVTDARDGSMAAGGPDRCEVEVALVDSINDATGTMRLTMPRWAAKRLMGALFEHEAVALTMHVREPRRHEPIVSEEDEAATEAEAVAP